MDLSGIDLRVLTYEIQDVLVGSWIVNIYHLPGGIFIFKVRKSELGLQFLLIEPGKRIHLTQFNRAMPKEPSNVCKTLRSHLKDKRINSIQQRDLDRIVTLNIGPDDGYNLVIELFGQGNMILVSPQNKILNALSYRKMRDRDIHPGRDFVQMPAVEKDIFRIDFSDLKSALTNDNKLVIILNSWLGLGPKYSRYILKKAGIKKKLGNELTPTEIEAIINVCSEIRDRLVNNDFEPIVYLDPEVTTKEEISDNESVELEVEEQWDDTSLPFKPEEVVKIQPWPQEEEDDDISTYFPETLGFALDIFYSSQESQIPITDDTEEMETGNDRLERLLQQQVSHQKALFESAEKYQKFGDLLYAYFQPGSELISTVYDARKKNMSWEEIQDRLEIGKQKNISSAKLLEELIPKEGKLKLMLADELGNHRVEVDFRKSLTDNANTYYTMAKKSKRKAKGADIAIEMTKQKLENAQKQTRDQEIKAKSSSTLLRRRKAWYEKFHWAFSPQGMLVIGGTDATTNERIVKKYLDADDVFLHADVQGAPATVIKTEGNSPNETTLEWAGKLAVCYSSAWKANLNMATAFYVEPDQVSFTPPSGEYLPKGSFMIYGSKSFVNDLPLELFVCLIVERNWAKLLVKMKQPEDEYWVKIIPGSMQRGSSAKMLKQHFIDTVPEIDKDKVKAIDVGEFAFLLPGDCQIVK